MQKFSRAWLGACAATLLFAAEALAAEAPAASANAGLIRPGPPPLERFVKPLALTTAQQAKLRPIFASAQAQAEADLEKLKVDAQKPDEAQALATVKMREADFRERLAGVLTAEQLARYNQMTADAQPREQAAETHPAHGHRDADSATAPD